MAPRPPCWILRLIGGGGTAAKTSGANRENIDMELSQLEQISHRRFNPLTREWVLVSPHRTQRPWLGKHEDHSATNQPAYDPTCYLCPGNERAGGKRNPPYTSTFVFDNDFPALLPDPPRIEVDESNLIVAQSEPGVCRVICFSPRHDLTISRMAPSGVLQIVDLWVDQSDSLACVPWIGYVQIFENRGELMGASNPHPHCQIWATATVPNEPAREQASFLEYRGKHDSCLLCDYLQLELKHEERIVCENDAFVVLVPYWAVWPFETMVLSRRHVGALGELSGPERALLAEILCRVTTRYDNVFEAPFPYSMGFHEQPVRQERGGDWHLHAHYFPPLLRSASVRKFMVGFELLGTPQRDFTPESAAARLREAGDVHYLDR
jgi:UDPglucose--hexose-1-phosphate uridylyltransferase